MGINNSKNILVVRQKSINDFYQESKTKCLTFSEQAIENVVVYLGPGAMINDISFNQNAKQSATCMLSSQLEALATTRLESIQAQLTEQKGTTIGAGAGFMGPVGFGGWFMDNAGINNSQQFALTDHLMQNVITQMITSECRMEARQSINRITVYLAAGAKADDLTFGQNTEQDLNCSILNTALVKAINDGRASQDQKVKQSGGLGEIILIIAIALAVVAVIGIIFKFSGKKKEKPKEEPEEEIEEEIEEEPEEEVVLEEPEFNILDTFV